MATVSELGVEISGDPTGLQRALDETRRMLEQLKSSVAASSKSFKGLGDESAKSLNQLTKAISQVSPEAGRMTESVISAFKAMDVAATVGTVAGVAAVAMLGKAAFDAAVEFDTAFDKIRVSTGATGEKLQALEGSFRTLFTSLPTTTANVAEALSFLSVRLGLSGEALEKLAKQELELARITGAALGPQLDATSKVFNKWQISTEKQSEALNYLFKVSQQTAVSVTDLSRSLVQSAAPLQELGFSFEQAAILVGKFTAEGINTEKMAMGLKKVLADMAKEGVTNASEGFTALIEKIKNTQNPMEQLKIAVEAFGQRAGTDLVQAIRAGRFELEEMKKKVDESTETVNKAAEGTNDFAESWTVLQNKTKEALEPLGKIIFDAFTAIVTTMEGKEDEIKKAWSNLWTDLAGKTTSGSNALVNILNSSFNAISNSAKAVAQGIYDGITGPIQRALDWIKGKAAAFEAAFAAITDAARRGLVIKSPPIAAQWVEMIGESATKSAAEVARSVPTFSEAFEEITGDIAKLQAAATAFTLDEVNKNMRELADEINSLPILNLKASLDLATEGVINQGKALKDGIGFWRDWSAFVGEAKRKQQEAADAIAKANRQLKDEFNDLSRSIPQAWNIIIDGIGRGLTSTEQAFQKFGVKIKGYAGDIINVFATMPGKWGDSLRRGLDEFNRWVEFIDSAVKLVQRILGSDNPSGLGGIISSIGSIFKKTTTEIQDESQNWSTALENMSRGTTTSMNTAATGIEGGAGRIVGAFTQIAAAALAFIGAKGQGFAGGAISGALAGISAAGGIAQALSISLSPLTLGLSALGGALIGGIIGLFGGGKSAAQKEQERLQLEKLKLDVQQSAQDVINAAIQGFDAALQFFEHLDEFTQVRKAKFVAFFSNLRRLMDKFVELAGVFSTESLAKAKAAAEAIQPIADAISALPNAFIAISGHFGVADVAIDRFFADFDKVMTRFFVRADAWIEGIAKRAMKVANRLLPVVELITNFGGALTSINDIKEPSAEVFDIIDRTLEMIVSRVSALADKFDKALLKTMANFADKAASALAIWSQAIEAIRATIDVPTVSAADVDRVVAGIEAFVSKLAGAADRLVDVDLLRASTLANSVLPIAEAIKAWAETANVVREYTQVAAEVWDSILADFERGLILIQLLIVDAQIYVEKADTFKKLIAQGSADIAAALGQYVGSIQSMSSILTGLPMGGTPIGTNPATSMAAMGTSGSPQTVSLTLNLSGSDPRTQQILAFIEQIFGAGTLSGTSSQFA